MGASVCRHNLPKRKWQETYAPRCCSSTAQSPGSEESNLFQEIREEPALVNQKDPCFWIYSKLVSIPRSPQSVRLSSHVERPLTASSLSSSARCLPQLPLDCRLGHVRLRTRVRVGRPLKLAPKAPSCTLRSWFLPPCPNSVPWFLSPAPPSFLAFT